MPFTLQRVRSVTRVEDLSGPIEREQVYRYGRAFDGVDRSVEDRFRELPVTPEALAEGVDWDDGFLSVNLLHAAAVYDDGAHVFDLWVSHGDNGALFVAGTAEMVAGRVQSSWMNPALSEDYDRASELDDAMRAAEIW